jgi:hypothetical protein
VLFVFFISKVHPAWHKVDYSSRITKSTPRGTKSTIVVASKVRSARQSKVDFGFQVTFSKLTSRGTNSTSVFKSCSKVRSDGTTTSQAPRLNAKLLLEISPTRGATLKLLLEHNVSRLRSLSCSGAPHQQLLDVAHTALLPRGLHAAIVLG